MVEQPDRIRVWNEETKEMMVPVTIQEMLSMERNVRIYEGWTTHPEEEHTPEDYCYLAFMRNTGVYAQSSTEYVNTAKEEIFAEDLVTHSTEPCVYRVVQKCGCWWALSLSPNEVEARRLNEVFNPRIVGNIFENRELVLKGEILYE